MSDDVRTSDRESIAAGLEEMRYETGVGSFGQDMSVSIPAQFRFAETPTQVTRRFHVGAASRVLP